MQHDVREHMAADISKLQRRLLSRDAAAKKYKEGCRVLKAQVEHLEHVRPPSNVGYHGHSKYWTDCRKIAWPACERFTRFL
jgi:hypothetical protein